MSDDRIDALERRLRELEDRQAIYQLMSAYGPLVDSGDAAATASLWVEDGFYDWGGGPPGAAREAPRNEGWAGAAYGRAEIEGMVAGPQHQSIIAGGAGHVIGLPHVSINGDTATAVGYARLYRFDGEQFVVARVSANRWDFVRSPDGWRIRARTNRPLDGSAAARAILSEAMAEGRDDER